MRGRWLAALLLVLLYGLRPAWGRAAPPDPRFGAVEAFFAPFDADEAGVAWERVLFYWREIQPEPDVWREDYFPPEILQREASAGREIVGLLINPPGWANGYRGDQAPPEGLYLPLDDPKNHWAQFVSRIVLQYRGVIQHWVLWNEPDVWDSSHFGYTWAGTLEEFVQLTRVGYLAAKRADPDCMVHLAGLTYWWDVEYGRRPFFERFLEEVAKDPNAAAHGFYFDVASLHIYFKPRTIPEIVAKTRAAMRRYGLDKPIWLDETNAPPFDDPQHPIGHPRFRVALSEQKAFLVQAFALALASGVERVAVYKMSDRPSIEPWEEPFGMVRLDGSRRPVYDAFRVAVAFMAGTERARWEDSGSFAVVLLDQGPKTTRILWNWTSEPVVARVPAAAPHGVIVSPNGEATESVATGGFYSISLPPAVCGAPRCDIGGMPVGLVEDAPASRVGALIPPTPTLAPSPAFTSTPRPSVAATATREPSPTPVPPAPTRPTLTSVAPRLVATPVPHDAEPRDQGRPLWAVGVGLAAVLGVAAVMAKGRGATRLR